MKHLMKFNEKFKLKNFIEELNDELKHIGFTIEKVNGRYIEINRFIDGLGTYIDFRWDEFNIEK